MAEIIMAFAPLVFLIVYALKTRKMAGAMILATLLAMVLLHRQHFLTGAIDAPYGALSNSSYQFVLCITIGFGGMITLFQESGLGFGDYLRAIPVFVPLALSMGVMAPVIIAAVMSGIGLGYSTCFYADAVFMTTAGTGVSNITIIKATLALCRRRGGGGCGGVPAVRDTGVREPAGRFRREAPLHILYGALTWRAAGDML